MAMDDGRWTMLIDTVQRTRLQCLVSHAIGMCAGCNAVAGVSEVQAALISSVRPKASAPIARNCAKIRGLYCTSLITLYIVLIIRLPHLSEMQLLVQMTPGGVNTRG
eukprot:1182573-Prorocentrum_minimum.AAC.4